MAERKFKSLLVDAEGDGSRLRDFIAEKRDCSKRRAKAMLDSRRVFVNRHRVWMAGHRLRKGDLVEFDQYSQGATRRDAGKISIVYRDRGMLIAEKPAGILTQGRGSVESRLRSQEGLPAIEAVHRLDRGTSGLLIFSLDADLRDELIEQFRRREVRKEYLAIAVGKPPAGAKKVEKRIDGKSAVTQLDVLDRGQGASLLLCRIETGRTHQIRIHLASLGAPVAGDKKYGGKKLDDRRLRRIPRQMLHAHRLKLRSPATGKNVAAESPPPADFMQTAKAFGLRISSASSAKPNL